VTRRPILAAAAALVAGACAGTPARTPGPAPAVEPQAATPAGHIGRLLDDPILARALVAVRIESLRDGRVVYARNSNRLVVPASNLKLLTVAAAADRLGWDYRYDTRLEAAGTIAGGVLHGDLVVVGGGDPSIAGQDFGAAPLFTDWAGALRQAGISRVDGRLIGDDRAFDSGGLGAGWAWDDLGAGYAAPTGALSYNEDVAVVRVWPGAAAGDAARVELSPPGHGLDVVSQVTTGATGSEPRIDLRRLPGSPHLTIGGSVPAGGGVLIRTAAVDNPTQFFVEALRLALADRNIPVSGGAWDIGDVADPPPAARRRVVATRRSEPLSALAGYCLKVSQNFYGETFLRTLGRSAGTPGSAEGGRQAVRETLTSWGIPADSYVMDDGSGLSRYDYVTADTVVAVLRHVWNDARLRGPFVAALPVGGRDGTLASRMKGTVLDDNVEAKTGTLANVRALSGYLETRSGEKLAFSIIVNNFTAPSAQVDTIVDDVLEAAAGGLGS
jgi:serine-type D-Ala-D-Ala carboxypeptidase/endopeptidase (penicillin-binding protein 4)